MSTFSASRHPAKPENTEALCGAGALERTVRRVCQTDNMAWSTLDSIPATSAEKY